MVICEDMSIKKDMWEKPMDTGMPENVTIEEKGCLSCLSADQDVEGHMNGSSPATTVT